MKVTIYWTCNREARLKICNAFSFPCSISINGETEVHVSEEILARLQEGERKGFFKIRHKP